MEDRRLLAAVTIPFDGILAELDTPQPEEQWPEMEIGGEVIGEISYDTETLTPEISFQVHVPNKPNVNVEYAMDPYRAPFISQYETPGTGGDSWTLQIVSFTSIPAGMVVPDWLPGAGPRDYQPEVVIQASMLSPLDLSDPIPLETFDDVTMKWIFHDPLRSTSATFPLSSPDFDLEASASWTEEYQLNLNSTVIAGEYTDTVEWAGTWLDSNGAELGLAFPNQSFAVGEVTLSPSVFFSGTSGAESLLVKILNNDSNLFNNRVELPAPTFDLSANANFPAGGDLSLFSLVLFGEYTDSVEWEGTWLDASGNELGIAFNQTSAIGFATVSAANLDPPSGTNALRVKILNEDFNELNNVVTLPILPPPSPAAELFSHASIDDPHKVRLRYVVPQQGSSPFDIRIVGGSESLLFEAIDQDVIQSNVNLTLQGEDASEALKPGQHTLIIDISGTGLEGAMLDDDVEEVTVQIDEQDNLSFVGIYQSQTSQRVAVRTGKNTDDSVVIQPSSASISFVSSAQLTSPTHFIVVTQGGNDSIRFAGDHQFAPAILWGGADDDDYEFDGKVQGSFTIKEAPNTGSDLIDFLNFIPGEGSEDNGIRLDLAASNNQSVAFGLEMNLRNGDAIEDVFGTSLADTIFGNARSNLLAGLGGNDLIVGRNGDEDILLGGPDDDVLIGDGFSSLGVPLTGDQWDNVAEIASSLDADKTFSIGFALEPTSGGKDIIDDGGGTDIVIGGDGGDEITGRDGTIVFGDSFSVASEFSLDFTDTFSSQVFNFALDIDHAGNGDDEIVLHSGNNLVIGGDGNDTITGGGDTDFSLFFGNDGTDIITATGSTNVIVGGANSPDDAADMYEELTGGSGIDIIFGDSISVADTGESDESFALPDLANLSSEDAVTALTGLLGLINSTGAESDRDRISTGSGFNLVVAGGGNDKVDGGDSIDVIFGNDGADEIDAKNGFNFIVGGAGDDPKLQGGTDTDIVFGDSIEITSGVETFNPADFSLSDPASYIKQLTNFFKKDSNNSTETAFGLQLTDLGNDTIFLGDGEGINLAFGGAGTDEIFGGSAGDVSFGGAGKDYLWGYGGVDLLVGGDGGDELWGGNDTSANFLFGDSVSIKTSNEIDLDAAFSVEGLLTAIESLVIPKFSIELSDSGDDEIHGGQGFDFIVGGKGQDEIWGGDGFNLAFGDDFEIGPLGTAIGLVADIVNPLKSATLSAAKLIVSEFYDLFEGAEGTPLGILTDKDIYHGGENQDFVFGGNGPDDIRGGEGFDFLVGGYGNDTLDADTNEGVPGELIEAEELFYGLIKFDNIAYGGPGEDTFFGSPNNDLLFSDLGSDIFYGGDGDDILSGGEGVDQLFGEAGNDFLIDEEGDNINDGGEGSDRLLGALPNSTSSNVESYTVTNVPGDSSISPDVVDQLVGPGGQFLVRISDDADTAFSGDWNYSGRRQVDSEIVHVLTSGDLEILVQNDLLTNPLQREDVNGDGKLTFQDVSLLMRKIFDQIRNGDGASAEVDPNAPLDSPLYDVNGDDRISPEDAKLVFKSLLEKWFDNRVAGWWIGLKKKLFARFLRRCNG